MQQPVAEGAQVSVKEEWEAKLLAEEAEQRVLAAPVHQVLMLGVETLELMLAEAVAVQMVRAAEAGAMVAEGGGGGGGAGEKRGGLVIFRRPSHHTHHVCTTSTIGRLSIMCTKLCITLED
jgi:hypothetical protein